MLGVFIDPALLLTLWLQQPLSSQLFDVITLAFVLVILLIPLLPCRRCDTAAASCHRCTALSRPSSPFTVRASTFVNSTAVLGASLDGSEQVAPRRGRRASAFFLVTPHASSLVIRRRFFSVAVRGPRCAKLEHLEFRRVMMRPGTPSSSRTATMAFTASSIMQIRVLAAAQTASPSVGCQSQLEEFRQSSRIQMRGRQSASKQHAWAALSDACAAGQLEHHAEPATAAQLDATSAEQFGEQLCYASSTIFCQRGFTEHQLIVRSPSPLPCGAVAAATRAVCSISVGPSMPPPVPSCRRVLQLPFAAAGAAVDLFAGPRPPPEPPPSAAVTVGDDVSTAAGRLLTRRDTEYSRIRHDAIRRCGSASLLIIVIIIISHLGIILVAFTLHLLAIVAGGVSAAPTYFHAVFASYPQFRDTSVVVSGVAVGSSSGLSPHYLAEPAATLSYQSVDDADSWTGEAYRGAVTTSGSWGAAARLSSSPPPPLPTGALCLTAARILPPTSRQQRRIVRRDRQRRGNCVWTFVVCSFSSSATRPSCCAAVVGNDDEWRASRLWAVSLSALARFGLSLLFASYPHFRGSTKGLGFALLLGFFRLLASYPHFRGSMKVGQWLLLGVICLLACCAPPFSLACRHPQQLWARG